MVTQNQVKKIDNSIVTGAAKDTVKDVWRLALLGAALLPGLDASAAETNVTKEADLAYPAGPIKSDMIAGVRETGRRPIPSVNKTVPPRVIVDYLGEELSKLASDLRAMSTTNNAAPSYTKARAFDKDLLTRLKAIGRLDNLGYTNRGRDDFGVAIAYSGAALERLGVALYGAGKTNSNFKLAFSTISAPRNDESYSEVNRTLQQIPTYFRQSAFLDMDLRMIVAKRYVDSCTKGEGEAIGSALSVEQLTRLGEVFSDWTSTQEAILKDLHRQGSDVRSNAWNRFTKDLEGIAARLQSSL